jgi:hypothetical protein
LSDSLCLVSRQFAGSARVSRYANAQLQNDFTVSARFENGIALIGARLSQLALRAGDPVCAELTWRAERTPANEYSVFVHLLDAAGNVVAQSDTTPGSGFAPTTTWPPSQPIIDRHGLILPPELAPGEYRLTAGLYDRAGARLKTTERDADFVLLSIVMVGR